MIARRLAPLALPLALSACAISQNVTPVAQLDSREICIVVNPAVLNPGFLATYESALRGKGYAVRELPPDSALTVCPVISTYTANWRWDMAMYMSYAEIKVFNHLKPAGVAFYDSRSGGANMGKFIKAEDKINELVNQLFPGAAADAPLRTGAAPA